MCEIAGRADSCIGSLYQFFPNKLSVAEALRDQYVKEIEQSWIALAGEAADLTPTVLAGRLVGLQIEIVRSHPVLLALLDVPPASYRRRELIRARIAAVLTSHNRRISKTTALRVASVVQQVTRGLLVLYAKTDGRQKRAVIEELKSVLTGYLVPKLEC